MLKHHPTLIFYVILLIGGLLISHFIFPIPNLYFWSISIIYFFLLATMSLDIGSNFFVPSIIKGPATDNHIALSFDDGPDQQVTPLVLDWLKEHKLTAIFFCIGNRIPGNEKLLHRIHQEGHLIGNHSFSHSYWYDFLPAPLIRKDLSKTNQLIEQVIGSKPNYFRPPYGVTTPAIGRALKRLPFKVIGWNIRTFDTFPISVDFIVKRVLKKMQPGSVLLFHDTKSKSIEILDQLLPQLEKQGIKIVPIDQLLKVPVYA